MESTIKKNVMRRVRTMHTVRPLMSGSVLSLAVLGVSLYVIGKSVFVAQIFRNMPAVQDVPALIRFFLEAFLHTEVLVQALTVAIVLSGIWMVHDGIRSLGSAREMRAKI